MSKPRPAVAYLRRSTDRQEQSIQDQRRAIERFAEEHGFRLLEEYVDDAISGTSTGARKAFQRLIADAQNGRRDQWRHVLVYDVKRFGRVDNDEAGHYRYLLRRAGVEVIYVSENFSGDDTDDLLRPVKQWQARQESRDLSKVTIRGQLSLSDGGWWVGGTPPWGFDLLYHDAAGKPYQVIRFNDDGTKDVLSLKGKRMRTLARGERFSHSAKDRVRLTPSTPKRVAVIRRIFQMYVSGLGFKAIAARLNEEGVPSPRTRRWGSRHDGHWALNTIRMILVNPAYAGDAVWNRRTFARFHSITDGRPLKRSDVSAGRWGQNDEEDWVVVRNTHEAIIEREMWNRVRAHRERRKAKSPGQWNTGGRGRSSPFLLTGLIRCQACGHKFQGYTITAGKTNGDGTKTKIRYYGCGGYITKGNAVCRRYLIRQDALDAHVMSLIESQIQKYLGRGGMAKLRRMVKEELARHDQDPRAEIGQLKKRIGEVDGEADRLLESISPANKDFVDRKLGRLRRERTRAESRLQDLESIGYKPPDVEATVDAIMAQLHNFPRVVSAGTVEERKQFVRAFVAGITIHPHDARGVVHMAGFPALGRETETSPSSPDGSHSLDLRDLHC